MKHWTDEPEMNPPKKGMQIRLKKKKKKILDLPINSEEFHKETASLWSYTKKFKNMFKKG